MSINRWDPWRDIVSLREAMNGLLEESFVRPRNGVVSAGIVPMDVRETEDAFVVEMPLPGVNQDDVEISVLGDKLRISGEFKDSHAERADADDGPNTAGRWLLRERRFGHFERSITLPVALVAEQASAEFEKGVLTIRLPKAEEARAKTIPVRATT